MPHPGFSYDPDERQERWNQIPAEKRSEWENMAKDLFRAHRTLHINDLVIYMGMAKWMVYMVLAPLIDDEKVYVTKQTATDLPVEMIYWEDYAEGEATG